MNSSVYKYLTGLHKNYYENEVDFMSREVPRLLRLLGYKEVDTYFDVSTVKDNRIFTVDAIVSKNRITRPWILIEAKYQVKFDEAYQFRLAQHKEIFSAEIAVLFSEVEIYVLSARGNRRYLYSELTKKESLELIRSLSPPKELPIEPNPNFNTKIKKRGAFKDEEDFDIKIYSELFTKVYAAKTNKEKGDSLENLTEYLMTSITFLRLKDKHLITATNEIDFVYEYIGTGRKRDYKTIFDNLGRFVLIECKNWNKPVNSRTIQAYISLLCQSQNKVALFIAKNGTSPQARIAVQDAFKSFGLFLIVISEEDLRYVQEGQRLYEIIDKKMYELQFGVSSLSIKKDKRQNGKY